ncbi:ABC transporter permease subunit [Rhizobium leguminosarum]|uniref:ABC transporter permease subunit n=1 Tax=Rhizobium leguminosarum TaxID=384 RepID=UPI001440F2E3|nr:ATP-binding cassette domain-containing protein [Rhizobium leguminosarum bv. viciae]NKL85566.1 ATP-binding cassette domain-containing protein [Rhizobium leguminosarum bv. viciae]NKL89362.1 ATP-binding cassette domain-containing protein [Rhizobium leguminosarum bv. viciae]NKM90330.1 ATP-binding cassette domain-containing protein [Rhizobium leguminosarum bv. viciae]
MRDRQKLRLVLLLALALTALLLIVFGPMFLGRFSLNVLTRSMIYAMLAITVDLLWGYTGVLTFGQAAFFGVGAYATAMVLTHIGASPALFVVALVAAVLVPLVLGLAVGWLSFYHGSTPLYATVISLVVPIVVTQLVFSGGTWTGSSSGLVGYETLPLGLPGYFRLSGACLLALAVLAIVFVRSDAGRLLVAIRDNEARVAYLGMNPARLKIVLTGVLAGVCGLAGFLFANASGVVAPENTGFVFGTELVVWTALGGRGTIIGPLFGAIGIDYLSASLSGDLPFLWQLIIGALFVAMIILLPGGLASLVTRFLKSANSSSILKSLPTRIVAKDGALAGKSLLSIRGLGKSYGSFAVLKGIDLEIGAGELVSLVGPNGAGKTTLMRCLSDGTQQIEGQVDIIGTNIAGRAPERIVALGVGRKFQVASIFDSMTIGECLKMARFSRERPNAMRSLGEIMLPAAAAEILTLTGMADMLDKPVSLLSHGQRQALELAMVVALEPRIILLDEPTAGLTKTERMTIGTILKKLTDEMGFAAILVEHDLDFVRDISSRIVVLHQGKLVLDGTVNDVVNSETVRTIYAGGAHG